MALIAPEVNPEPIRPPQLQPTASLETFGGGPGLENEGKQIQQIAQSGGEIASFEKIRADQSAIEEAVGSKLSPAITQMLYDPKNGALARISRSTSMDEALKIHDETLKQYDDAAKGIAGKLKGENQIGAFNRHAFEFGSTLNRTIMAHVDQHGRELDKNSFNSFVDNTISQSALGWGNLNPRQQAQNLQMLDEHAEQFGMRNGYDPNQVTALKSKINSNYHSAVIDRMLADGNPTAANEYFKENKQDISNLNVRADVEKNLETVPRQQESAAKKEQEETYKNNERQSLMDMLDGNLTLSEAQRRFRNDEIDKSTFNHLESKLSKPDAYEQAETSSPATFNAIRQAQLNKSATPNEILRMISDGQSDKELRPDDIKYLQKMTQDLPASPRDQAVEAQANNLRAFGNRYFAETNFLGNATNQDKTKSAVDDMVSQFYRSVDSSKASGEQLKDLRNQVIETAVRKKYPGIPPGKLPDIVVDVKGRVTRLLNPEEPSAAKAKYRITPTESQRPSDE